MKTGTWLTLVTFAIAVLFGCSSGEEADLTGEFVIYMPEGDEYGIHNGNVEIVAQGESYVIRTDVIGGSDGAESSLKTAESPYTTRFESGDFTSDWRLTPLGSDAYSVIWRDNSNVDDVRFELHRATEEELARVAEEQAAADNAATGSRQTDLSSFIIEPEGSLDIDVFDLVKLVHGADDDEFAQIEDTYKGKRAVAASKVESISEELKYDGLYKIITYRDFDNNSWNKNTMRLTLYTDNRELAFSHTKNELYDFDFAIIEYETDTEYYVISIEGTLLTSAEVSE